MTILADPGLDSASPLSVAVVGNMNNNGFSLLRYFCDLGVDARLYPFANDGQNFDLFVYSADTWRPENWSGRIHMLDFVNNARSLYPRPFNLGSRHISRAIQGISDGHDLVVGSGIAPALFAKAGRRLDAFFPYATGVELVEHLPFVAAMNRSALKRPLYRYARDLQVRGILEARYCFNAEMSLSKTALDSIGRSFDRLSIPMVYNGEVANDALVPRELVSRARHIRAHELVIFCHSRHLWVQDPALSADQFSSFTKNSDWLLRGFARFVRERATDALLCLVEYGPDVDASKELVRTLGIADRVMWLPKMKRREIMYLLDHVDIGVGEFHVDPGIIWGGTGWEILAAGKPLLQAFNFTHDGYQSEFGHVPPPVQDAKSAEAIAERLTDLHLNPQKRMEIGAASVEWFNLHNGIGMARRWWQTMTESGSKRSDGGQSHR